MLNALTVHSCSVGIARRPWLFTAFVVAVCAALAARAGGALLDAKLLREGPDPPLRPVVAAAAAPAVPPRPDPEQLVVRNMFCSRCAPGGPGGAPDPAAGIVATQASLIATGLGREPYAALVVAATAAQGAWGLGEAIPGLGRLERIAPTWVEIIDGSGRRGRLSLREVAAGRDPVTAMPGTAPAAWAERIRRLDDTSYEVDRSLVRELVTGVTRPGRVRPVPVLAHGEIAGIRLFGVGADSIPAALGLATGDVVNAVNGAPIKSLQQLFELYAGLDQLSSVEVSGTRDGVPLVRTLRLR
ncbi:MAG TPA: hypothetical protein VK607_16445 [Kofleriaceae bacterium]|nr:hypothetical protein [Kofleriaceae bacterium]